MNHPPPLEAVEYLIPSNRRVKSAPRAILSIQKSEVIKCNKHFITSRIDDQIVHHRIEYNMEICNSHKSNKDDARDTKRCLRRRSMGSVERRRPCRGTRKELKEGIVDPTQLPKQSQATVSLRSMHAFDHHRPLICAVAPFFVRTEK
ncbi:CLUMA_CG004750, isoform A [Clunio marinus]|uniref:CLUMA_CG004750, isoform A n=1 Tax=Clunio marinus TaxID=568069 RepID=A0A1J1HX11_9DIPT|nr:CLUMA_CG004750, isoform A [Clunio marinus]